MKTSTRLSAAFAATCFLAAPVAADPVFVPIQQLLEETRDTPYECFGYDPTTDTCTEIARIRLIDGLFFNISVFEAPGEPGEDPWQFRSEADYRPVFGWACRIPHSYVVDYVSGGDPGFAEDFEAVIMDQAYELGSLCGGYHRTGEATYTIEFRNDDGTEVGLPDSEARFFASPKALRP